MIVSGYLPIPSLYDPRAVEHDIRHHPQVPSRQLLVNQQRSRIQAMFETGNFLVEGDGPESVLGARVPFVDGLDESSYEFSIQDFEGEPCVVVEFSHESAPTVRFLHRFRPLGVFEDDHDAGTSDLLEGVACSWLMRSRARVGPGATLVWTDFSWGHPNERLGWAMDLLGERRLAEAASWLRGPGASEWDLEMADVIEALVVEGAPSELDLQGLHMRCRDAIRVRHEANSALTQQFWEEHVRIRG